MLAKGGKDFRAIHRRVLELLCGACGGDRVDPKCWRSLGARADGAWHTPRKHSVKLVVAVAAVHTADLWSSGEEIEQDLLCASLAEVLAESGAVLPVVHRDRRVVHEDQRRRHAPLMRRVAVHELPPQPLQLLAADDRATAVVPTGAQRRHLPVPIDLYWRVLGVQSEQSPPIDVHREGVAVDRLVEEFWEDSPLEIPLVVVSRYLSTVWSDRWITDRVGTPTRDAAPRSDVCVQGSTVILCHRATAAPSTRGWATPAAGTHAV